MITMLAAAVLAAQPTTPAPAAPPMQHDMHMKMDQKDMDCCKDCCDHMNADHRSVQREHGTQQQ